MAVQVETRNGWSDRLDSLRVGGSLHLRDLSWADYSKISDEIGERRFLTYFLEGEMEIVWPYSQLLPSIYLLDRFVCSVSNELKVPRWSLGMSTRRRDDLEIAIEPCRSFYFTNKAKRRGRMELDLRVIPPPDLAIEVDVGQNVETRMRAYAGLGVTEVWRFDGERLSVNQLVANGKYAAIERSRYFPLMPISEFVRFQKESV